MTYTESESQVRAILNNVSADVADDLATSLKYLNNYFVLRDFDSSLSTTAGQKYIVLPTSIVDVLSVSIGDVDYALLPSSEYSKIVQYEKEQLPFFYILDSKIYLTITPASVETVNIFAKKRFNMPSGTDWYDVPPELEELVILGAVHRYYLKLLMVVNTSFEDMADTDSDRLRRVVDVVSKRYTQLVQSISRISQYAI